jgi:hypothetical protein
MDRWKAQHDGEWYKSHVKEIMVNDIDGTKNATMCGVRRKNGKGGKYRGGLKARLRPLP